MTISIFLMGAQLKCARALSKIYKPSRTIEGATPLQRYRRWPAVCAACVLSNTHTNTHTEATCLIITLFMSSAAVAVLNLLFVVGAVVLVVVVAVLECCGSCCSLVLQARLGMFYSCFF